MCFHKPVQFRLKMYEAITAKAISIFLIHIRPLFRADRNTETLALRDIARLAGKRIATSRAFP